MHSHCRVRSIRDAVTLRTAFAWVVAASSVGVAGDEAGPSATKGYAIAQSLCVSCHLLPDRDAAMVPAGVPTFRAIANRPGQTGDKIMLALIKPHAPMPDIQMSREEILSIVAYLETLRTDPAVPPLLPPGEHAPVPKPPSKT